jgi:putative endonuclease
MAAYIYIMTNKTNTVLYTGVTSNLIKRVCEHKEGLSEGFTSKYNVKKLIYYEVFHDIITAIEREKQIKSWKRIKKEELINSMNSSWRDLYEDLI